MPDKLCRTCGGDLIKWSTCSECRKVTQKICRTCSMKTIEEFHSHSMYLEPYQIANTRNTVATVQSYHNPANVKNPKKKDYKKDHKSNILVIGGIVIGIIILGISGINYLESFSDPNTPEIQVIPPSDHPSIVQPINEIPHVNIPHPSTDVKYTYINCLGISNGKYLTVVCPTVYGDTYKAVVDIPSDLSSQFDNKVFNLRGLSIMEHANYISIQYAKKTYEVKFVNG